MIKIYIKEHYKKVCDIDIVSDCRVIETIHTDMVSHDDKIKELVAMYGNLPVVVLA